MNLYKQERTINRNAGLYVQEKKPFRGNNLDGFWLNTHLYVVCSYAWPIYIYDTRVDMWHATEGNASKTTARHMACAQPHGNTIICTKNEMQQLIRGENRGNL